MKIKPTPKEPNKVSCEVCLSEIPDSVTMSSEGDEYAHHYCGIECYDKWRDNEELSASVESGSENSKKK